MGGFSFLYRRRYELDRELDYRGYKEYIYIYTATMGK